MVSLSVAMVPVVRIFNASSETASFLLSFYWRWNIEYPGEFASLAKKIKDPAFCLFHWLLRFAVTLCRASRSDMLKTRVYRSGDLY